MAAGRAGRVRIAFADVFSTSQWFRRNRRGLDCRLFRLLERNTRTADHPPTIAALGIKAVLSEEPIEPLQKFRR